MQLVQFITTSAVDQYLRYRVRRQDPASVIHTLWSITTLPVMWDWSTLTNYFCYVASQRQLKYNTKQNIIAEVKVKGQEEALL